VDNIILPTKKAHYLRKFGVDNKLISCSVISYNLATIFMLCLIPN